MKKILVTGAGGLVGYDVVKTLINNSQYQVFAAVHNKGTSDWQDALEIDLENTDIESLKIEFDYIVHCAARIPNSIDSDEQVAIINRCMDDNIIEYCVSHGCKLIYISTAALYGYEDNVLLSERTKLRTDTHYKAEKRNSEIRIESKCSSYCALRISSPYGPRQKNIAVLKKFVDAVSIGEDIYYFGSGQRTQNFIDVRDIAGAVLKCVECEENGIFNIANKESISMKELANLVLMIGKGMFNTTSEVHAGNSADPQERIRVNIDISLAKERIGWSPQIKLEDGIRYWMKNMKVG